MSKLYNISLLPGDGIGSEVLREGVKVIDCIGEIFSIKFNKKSFDWNSEYYLKTGIAYPEQAMKVLSEFDAIYLGALGDPRVPDHVSVRLIIDMRCLFDQYVNLRPIKKYEGVPMYVKGLENKNVDFCVVRENTEGEYSNIGGCFKVGTEDEVAVQTSIFTYKGIERITKYGFELSEKRRKTGITETSLVTNCTKSNALKYSMVTWDKIFNEVAMDYPLVNTQKAMVDAITMWIIKNPEEFDVIVASNLFGDIISDLGAILVGGLGFAPGANINPEKKFPSLFEPIHGSAPKYAGKNVANPIATILSAQMMLEHLNEFDAADMIGKSVEKALRDGLVKTKDMGGNMATSEVGDVICNIIRKLSK